MCLFSGKQSSITAISPTEHLFDTYEEVRSRESIINIKKYRICRVNESVLLTSFELKDFQQQQE